MGLWRPSDPSVQPCTSGLPLPLHGGAGDIERFTDVFQRQAAEEPQFRYPALSVIEGGEVDKRCVQIEDVDILRIVPGNPFVESYARPSARSLGHLTASGMVYQDT